MTCQSNLSEIRTGGLSVDKIDQAYPLVRELSANLTLEAWRDYASAYLRPPAAHQGQRGIIVAEHRGCIRGLLCYDILGNLFEAATLAVRDVIVLGIPAGQPAARSLLQQLFAIAGAHRCGVIRIDLPDEMSWLAREWSDPSGALFRFPVLCFLPDRAIPVPPGGVWTTPPADRSATERQPAFKCGE